MPLTTENTGAALIGGRPIPTEVMVKTRKVRVIRAFYFDRTVQAKGSIVELPNVFASEMIAAQKAESFDEPDVSAVSTAKSEERAVRGRRENKDVGE